MARYEQLAVSSRESQGKPTGDGEAPADVAFTIGAEVGTTINVAVQLARHKGGDNKSPGAMSFYLADDTVGLDPATVAPSAGIAIGTDGALIESVANLSGLMISEANGSIDIDMDEAGVLTKYLVVVLPSGELAVSGAITWA